MIRNKVSKDILLRYNNVVSILNGANEDRDSAIYVINFFKDQIHKYLKSYDFLIYNNLCYLCSLEDNVNKTVTLKLIDSNLSVIRINCILYQGFMNADDFVLDALFHEYEKEINYFFKSLSKFNLIIE